MPTAKTTTQSAKKNISYQEAMTEIETILAQMNSSDLQLDQLAQKVKRANELMAICKEKLRKTKEDVEKILEKSGE